MKPFLFSLLAAGTTTLAVLYGNNLANGDDQAVSGFVLFSALSGGSLMISAVSISDAILDGQAGQRQHR